MIKGFIGILVLGAMIGWAIYYFGPGTYDPDTDGRRVKQAITEGMSWREVCDQASPPRRYVPLRTQKSTINGEEYEHVVRGAEMEFDRELFERSFDAGQFAEGFIFPYFFSNQVAFEVSFDSEGKVDGIENTRTAADLLQMRQDD